jgi:hypothetical protein
MTRGFRRVSRPAALGAGIAALALGAWPAAVVHAATTSVGCTGTPADAAALILAINTASSGDTVSLASGCTYTLTAVDSVDNPGAPDGPDGLPPIAKTLTIAGNGAKIARGSGAPLFRILEVKAATSNLTVDNLTLSNGAASGGGFPVGFGGAIFNSGTLTVRTSTLSGNSASGGSGGGVYNDAGTVTINTSTLSGNATSGAGGAGSGVYTDSGTVTVIASTLTGNTANLVNGGGIANDGGSMTVSSSILAGNTGGSCFLQPGSTITDGGHNLDDGTSCGFVAATDKASTNPLLGPLQNNGGPTWTMALLSGSPAIDTGPTGAACTSTNASQDQRGMPRPDVSASACDIGAFEFQVAKVVTPAPSVPPTGAPNGLFGAGIALAGTALALGALRRRRRDQSAQLTG